MANAIESLIIKIFGGNSYLATFFISMIPFIELKGAIPFGMSEEIFGSGALSPINAWIAASTGALVPAFFIGFLFPKILNILKRGKRTQILSQKIENAFREKGGKLGENEKARGIKKYVLLTLFVAIPLPLTGAYTGSMIGSIFNFSYVSLLSCIFIGNIISGGIVVLLCTLLKGYEIYVFLAFVALLFLAVLIRLIRKVRRQRA